MVRLKLGKKLSNRRAVAPVIATLLLVAIAVTGGTVIFSSTQEMFDTSQVSGYPNIEFLEIVGYDARDVNVLQAHNGLVMATPNSGGDANGAKQKDERIGVYIQNHGTQAVIISKLLFAGTKYVYAGTTTLDAFGPGSSISGSGGPSGEPQYGILIKTDGTSDTIRNEPAPIIKAGEVDTIILALDSDFKIGRDVQFQIETTNGAIFVGTVIIGSASDSTSLGGSLPLPPPPPPPPDCDDDDDDDEECDD